MSRRILEMGACGRIPIDNLFEMYFDLHTGDVLKIFQTKIMPSLGSWVYDAAFCLAKYLESKHLSGGLGGGVKGKTVIELGAGTGVVGLVAGYYGAEVVVSDLESLVPLMQLNIDENANLMRAPVHSMPLIWGSDVSCRGRVHLYKVTNFHRVLIMGVAGAAYPSTSGVVFDTVAMTEVVLKLVSQKNPQTPSFDLVVLANCVYYESSLEPLLETLLSLTGPNTLVLACYEERTNDIQALIGRWHAMAGRHFDIETIPFEGTGKESKHYHSYVKFVTMKLKSGDKRPQITKIE